jgi:RNA polymerase sigma-70 factor (ECF subfamily)
MRATRWSSDTEPPATALAAVPSGHAEDLQLVARMLDGEEAAAASFAERYTAPLYRFAAGRLRGDRELTRDIVQTTLTKALARLDSYRGEAALLTWLCACCRNEILMHLRRGRGAPPVVELAEAEVAADSGAHDAEAALLRAESASRVHVTLDALPARYAHVLEWKYLEQLSVEAIALRLGVGIKAAESLLGRARRAFRETHDDLERETGWRAGSAAGEGDDR